MSIHAGGNKHECRNVVTETDRNRPVIIMTITTTFVGFVMLPSPTFILCVVVAAGFIFHDYRLIVLCRQRFRFRPFGGFCVLSFTPTILALTRGFYSLIFCGQR